MPKIEEDGKSWLRRPKFYKGVVEPYKKYAGKQKNIDQMLDDINKFQKFSPNKKNGSSFSQGHAEFWREF